jgi:hypothetical protein
MKKILFYSMISMLALGFSSCGQKNADKDKISTDVVNNNASADGKGKSGTPKFKFNEESFNFGNVFEGEKVTHPFKFKNVGDGDLVIASASGSCGCTVPEYPKTPIPPGGEAVVNVTFNSEGKMGINNKTITIIANTEPNSTVLTVICQVIK